MSVHGWQIQMVAICSAERFALKENVRLMPVSWIAPLVVSLSLLFSFEAAAIEPTALVEEVSASGAGVEAFDQVVAGRVIRLPSGTTLVLAYLKSCMRESISGGIVTIGAEQSAVAGGNVQRTRLECPGAAKLRSEQAGQAGAAVFRAPPRPAASNKPEVVIYGASPVLQLPGGGGRLRIERVDQQDAVFVMGVENAQLQRGAFLDLAAHGVSLAAGGLYRIGYGTAPAQLVRVAPRAQPGKGPVLPRLLQF